jgi:hypothetical protein
MRGPALGLEQYERRTGPLSRADGTKSTDLLFHSQHHHRGKRSRSFGIFFHQLDAKDGRRDASWPSRSNAPVSTWNDGATAIDRACLLVHQQVLLLPQG